MSRSKSDLHERMIRVQIRAYKDKGIQVIAADLEGWSKPDHVGSHIPDIVARIDGQTVFNECETCETIGIDQTRKQHQDFSKHGDLEVTVPKSCIREAQRYAKQWGIEVKTWWEYG